jgi:hypothetical protein
LRRLHTSEIEQAFLKVIADVGVVCILDGIDLVPELSGLAIRTHDFYGPLPRIVIEDTGDRYLVLERISAEGARMTAVVRFRQELATAFPGTEFLLPTSTEAGVVVGVRVAGRVFLGEAASYWEPYHDLVKQMNWDGT